MQTERECIWCKKVRRTTNKEEPYLCEIDLRSKGREELLNILHGSIWKKLKYWLFG